MIAFPFDFGAPWLYCLTMLLIAWFTICTLRYFIFIVRPISFTCIKGKVLSQEYSKRSINKESGDVFRVFYSYVFEGNKYFNSKISPVEYFFPYTIPTEQRIINNVHNKCMIADEVEVFFDKKYPHKSYLNVDVQYSRFVLSLSFIFALLVIILFVLK